MEFKYLLFMQKKKKKISKEIKKMVTWWENVFKGYLMLQFS